MIKLRSSRPPLYMPTRGLAVCPQIHLKQFVIGIKRLKEKHPELFPFTLTLNSWSRHCCLDFKKLCKKEGIILLHFHSHSTMWACSLVNGPFVEYEKVYNTAILRERSQWKGKGRLPFALTMRVVKKACDVAFQKDVIRSSFTKTLFSPLTATGLTDEQQLQFAQADVATPISTVAGATDTLVMIHTAGSDAEAIPHLQIRPIGARVADDTASSHGIQRCRARWGRQRCEPCQAAGKAQRGDARQPEI